MYASQSSISFRDLVHPSIAALVSVIVNYGGTFILVFQAAKVAGLTPELTRSWVWSLSIGVGITGIMLSAYYRAPIITAWSTPAAAFLIVALAHTSYSQAIGAYLISGLGFVVLGLSGYFDRLIRLIPPAIASGLLAGILLRFGINVFSGVSLDPILVGSLILIYFILKRFSPRYAVLGILLCGLIFLSLQGRIHFSNVEFSIAWPVFSQPEFSWNALFSLTIPLFLITLTGQYMPGMLVLRNDGYTTPANHIVSLTGLASFIMAPFGSHAINLAAITAAICTGEASHRDTKKRWLVGVVAGLLYIIIGIFGVALVGIFMAFPSHFITTLAGLALLNTIGASLSQALADTRSRDAALITFLACASDITLFDISGAFWGLLLGIVSYHLFKPRPALLPPTQKDTK